MSHRVHVSIPDELGARIAKAARSSRTSKGAWVRCAIEEALERRASQESSGGDPLLRLASLGAPTFDIDEMISEIDSGRS